MYFNNYIQNTDFLGKCGAYFLYATFFKCLNICIYSTHMLSIYCPTGGPMHKNSCKIGLPSPRCQYQLLSSTLKASLIPPPKGTWDPGWIPSSPGLVRKHVWNDDWKTSGLISLLPFYYYRSYKFYCHLNLLS